MQPRLSLRSPLKLPVTLSLKDKKVTCTSRDFSLGGMYLEAKDFFISAGAEVIISFYLHQDHSNKWHSLSAKIIHTKADGAGVSFQQIDKSAFSALQELLHFTRQQNLH